MNQKLKQILKNNLLTIGEVLAVLAGIRFFMKKIPAQVVKLPDNRLRKKCTKVEKINGQIKKIAKELEATLKKVGYRLPLLGIGIAAPQLGYAKRVVIIRHPYRKYIAMVNPEITKKKWLFTSIERCLSIRGLHVLKRYMWVRVRYMDLNGNTKELTLRGAKAAVMQQEIDHLDGVLICDY